MIKLTLMKREKLAHSKHTIKCTLKRGWREEKDPHHSTKSQNYNALIVTSIVPDSPGNRETQNHRNAGKEHTAQGTTAPNPVVTPKPPDNLEDEGKDPAYKPRNDKEENFHHKVSQVKAFRLMHFCNFTPNEFPMHIKTALKKGHLNQRNVKAHEKVDQCSPVASVTSRALCLGWRGFS